MERPRTLDPTEFKRSIRHLNGTNNPQHDAFNYSNFNYSLHSSMIFKNNVHLKLNNLLFVYLNLTPFIMVLLF